MLMVVEVVIMVILVVMMEVVVMVVVMEVVVGVVVMEVGGSSCGGDKGSHRDEVIVVDRDDRWEEGDVDVH